MMGIQSRYNHYDLSCQPYSEQFSPDKQTKEIKDYGFPIANKRKTIDCKKTRNSDWLQKGAAYPVIDYAEPKEVVNQQLSLNQIQHYETAAGIVELNADGIEMAVDRRVAHFLQQAILCYKLSDFIFTSGNANDQVGSASKITLKAAQGKNLILKREAAHPSTFPTLIAEPIDGSPSFVFLKGGSSYHQQNATIGMHVDVNGADELIDGKGADKKLRYTALKIINKVAKGLDPIEGTKLFIEAFETEVRKTIQDFSPKKKGNDYRKEVLNIYLQHIEEIKLNSQNTSFFDNLVGVSIGEDVPRETKLREVVYKKRFDIIRLQEVIENRIRKRIEDEKCGGRNQELLNYALVQAFKEEKEQKIMEKILSISNSVIKDQSTRFTKKQIQAQTRFKTSVDNFTKKNRTKIDKLMRDLRKDFRELNSAEMTFRAGVFKDLRTQVNTWSQVEFCEEFYKKNKKEIKQHTVSRLEQLSRLNTKPVNDYKTPLNQRRKYIHIEDVKEYAKTFEVDIGIFLPALFTSVY